MSFTGAAKKIRRNFDQVSVICVFGSVVGCVVLPLVMQSLESFIFTAILFGITLKTLFGSKLFPANGEREIQEDRRRGRDEKKTKKHSSVHQKKPLHAQVLTSSEAGQRLREEDLKKQEELRQAEKERRLEEKREKKARKKEERVKRKEEEKREREKEEELRRQRVDERAVKKATNKEKRGRYRFSIPTLESIRSIVSSQKPVRRERKNSTSSTASSVSAHSNTPPHSHKSHMKKKGPLRVSSDPQLSFSSPSPSPPRRAWQVSPQWSSDNVNASFPNLQTNMADPANLSLQTAQQFWSSTTQQAPPPLWACPNSAPNSPSEFVHPATPPSLIHPETVGNNIRPVETLRPQTGWLPSATNHQYYWAAPGHHLSNRNGFIATDTNIALSANGMNTAAFTNGGSLSSLDNGCYSLFSDQSHLPFGPSHLFTLGTFRNDTTSTPTPVDYTDPTTVASSNLLLSGENSTTAAGYHGDDIVCKNEEVATSGQTAAQQRVEFDEWPNL